MQPLQTTTIHWLVVVSVLTSIAASYAAFSFADRVATAKGTARALWLTSGALAMGLGIWSMHYLGMLSVRLPVDVIYHVPTVLLSLLLGVLASVVVLVVATGKHVDLRRIALGSVLMGAGIGAMHYTGMHAMRSTAMHHYHPAMVGFSVVVAVVFSWIALWTIHSVRAYRSHGEWLRLCGAALMGLGIAAMHYTAMAAVTFMPGRMTESTENTVHITSLGVVAVALITGLVLVGALITTLLDRQLYEQLSEERDRLRAITDASMDGLFICTAARDGAGDIEDFIIAYLNKNAEKMVALPASVLLGARLCEVLPVVRSLGLFESYRQVVLTGQNLVHEFAVEDKNVVSEWIRVHAVKLRDGVAICASDITERKKNEQRIAHLAQHDPLTGLINRSLLNDRIGQGIERAKRFGGQVGVFLIDLDDFKRINDTLGHSAGDTVLIAVAKRLLSVVRASDSVIRIGGDEFVIILPGVARPQDIHSCAEKLLEVFQPSVIFEGQPIQLSCSVGVAVYPNSALEVEELLSRADTAMYAAKNRGKNQYEVFGSVEFKEMVARRDAAYVEASPR